MFDLLTSYDVNVVMDSKNTLNKYLVIKKEKYKMNVLGGGGLGEAVLKCVRKDIQWCVAYIVKL